MYYITVELYTYVIYGGIDEKVVKGIYSISEWIAITTEVPRSEELKDCGFIIYTYSM